MPNFVWYILNFSIYDWNEKGFLNKYFIFVPLMRTITLLRHDALSAQIL
jgi:hypothetical protein